VCLAASPEHGVIATARDDVRQGFAGVVVRGYVRIRPSFDPERFFRDRIESVPEGVKVAIEESPAV
jgi:hypothetical protein